MTTQRTIGRYEIKSKIARGGMATVFHAYDPRFERDVAIKVLPAAFLHDPQFRVRFEREAKMIALLEHPAIVPVYDFGEDDGTPYIVMRYMSGGTLTDRLTGEPLQLAETAQIVFRLAPALDAAHARGIIHRDMKPGNVLFDQYGNAYLSDFGIARLAAANSATLTGESILGTPTYMSPEQVQGEKGIDGRSDIYALGVMVYQMLAGQVPYQADTPAKVMMMHVLQPTPTLQKVRPDLPVECDMLIQRSMAKSPDDRYTSAGEFSAALEAAVHGIPGMPSLTASRSTPVNPDTANRPDFQMPTAAASGSTVVAPGATVVSSPTMLDSGGGKTGSRTPAPAAAGQAAPAARSGLPVMALVAIVLCLLLGGVGAALAYAGSQGSGPLAMLAPASATPVLSDTPVPTALIVSAATEVPPSPVPPTDTPVPASPTATIPAASDTPAITATPTPVAVGPTIGGADLVAYINAKDIWVASLDGKLLEQLTDDKVDKSNLQWSPDGTSVHYISGKCAYAVRLEDKQKEILTCINFVQYFKSFEISPDGKQVAMSLDNQLYVLPYDLSVLRSISVRSDLTKLATCKELAPYTRFFVKFPRWGRDGSTMSMIIMGRAANIGTADTLQYLDFSTCTAEPQIRDNFPPPRFIPEEYKSAPTILSFGWDGLDLFTFSTLIRMPAWGKLYVYNSDLKKGSGPLNPVSECCYSAPIFSPDGTHLLFAYQQYPGGDGSVQLYMIPYGTLGTGQSYTPLPLPAIDSKSWPIPTLRRAK
jgi:serine/threonine protein kinase